MPKAPFTPDLPVKLFKSQDAWAKWLEMNHAKSPGIWMRAARREALQP